MRARALLTLLVLLVLLVLPGCVRDEIPEGPSSTPPPGTPEPAAPPLRFGGRVVDVLTREVPANVTVRIDLAQELPCGRPGIGWASWEAPVENGTWGPVEVPRPRSDEVAFFLRASAPGYTTNDTMIGPAQARGDIGNLTLQLHPDAAIQGRAPPGTLLALDAPPFPRVVVADANGSYAFPRARVVEAAFVAAVDTPFRARVAAPAEVDVAAAGRGWTLEGSVRGPTGAPLAADIVAWNGAELWSVARSSETGAFTMPLAPEPAELRLHARTSDGRFGGVLRLEVNGPPALRETLPTQPLC